MKEIAKHYLSLQIEIAFGKREGLDKAILDRIRRERDDIATILRRAGWRLE